MGGDGWDSSKLFEIGGAALDGCYFSNHYTPTSPEPLVQNYVKHYQDRFHHTPDALATLAYDAGGYLGYALKSAKSFSGADIRDALASVKKYPGVTGVITLDKGRDPIKSAVVLEVQGGKANYVTTVNP
jgi:branched-chain amino acid transport system substrate-binding protein